jgi:hypothetical protein
VGPGAVGLPEGFVLDDLPEGFVLDGAEPVAQEESGRKVGTAETIVRNVSQGITFNTADEISSGLGAVYDLATGKRGFKDAYNDRVQAARAQDAEIAEQRPVLSTLSQAAGGVATLPLGGTASAATALGRIAKTGAQGGAYGALSGFGAGEGMGDRLDKAKSGALIGAAAGAGTQAVANAAGATARTISKGAQNARQGVSARGGEELAEASAKLKEQGTVAYKAARAEGGTLSKETAKGLLSNIEKASVADGKLHPKLHRDTIAAIDDLKALVERGDVGLDDLDQTRQILGRVVFDNTDAIKGANTDAHRAATLLEKLDDYVEALDGTDGWKKARDAWKQYRQFETVANAVAKGEGDPGRIKRHLNNLLANKRKTRGFSQETMATLREAAKASSGERVLKLVGSFGFDSTGVLRNIAAGGAATLGGPTGMGLALTGTAARQLEKLVGRGKAEKLLQAIEAGQGARAVQNLSREMGDTKARAAIKAMLEGVQDGQAKTILQQAQEALDKKPRTPGAVRIDIGKRQ